MSNEPNNTTPEKIIFLDIDGVLTTTRTTAAEEQGLIPTQFDPLAIAMLNQMCKEIPAKIVIASSWLMFGNDPVKGACASLAKAGLKPECFHHDWCIDASSSSERGASIDRWCAAHGTDTKDYVIFDDNGKSYGHAQKTRWFKPHPSEGLLLEHCWNAASELGGPENSQPVKWGIRLV